MNNNHQVSPNENLIATQEKRNWISPDLIIWSADNLEAAVGPIGDGIITTAVS